jgi:hypothetical protein
VAALLHPLPASQLRIWPVARTVNNVRNDGPELLVPCSLPVGQPSAQAYVPEVPVEVRGWIGPAPASPDLVLGTQPPTQPHSRVAVVLV